jgi:hypothetical protein
MFSLVRGHSWEMEIRERSFKMINVIIKKKIMIKLSTLNHEQRFIWRGGRVGKGFDKM